VSNLGIVLFAAAAAAATSWFAWLLGPTLASLGGAPTAYEKGRPKSHI